MKKRVTALLLILCMAFSAAAARADVKINWSAEERAKLHTGNPTAMSGRFFTTMWGGTTSDLDAQDLLHAYAPVRYDTERGRFRFDRSVVRTGTALDDRDGNRTYLLVFYDDLLWSDGTPITAYDYAYSILFQMDPAIRESGGKPADFSWIRGAEEYLQNPEGGLSGLTILSDQILKIQARAEALPWFCELERLEIHPYPAKVITPGITVKDEGNGAFLTERISAETLQETVLDPDKGYLTHPSVVSGPYKLKEYDWPTATFSINPYFKGTEDGYIPRIGEIEYTLARNSDMIAKTLNEDFELLNKVTLAGSIMQGMRELTAQAGYQNESYPRTGLTTIRFREDCPALQETAVRKAIACCFDREGFTRAYAGDFGTKVDGFYGIGQWTYILASGLPGVISDAQKEAYAEALAGLEDITLAGLTRYSPDAAEADRLLESAGWKKNVDGQRVKTEDGRETALKLTLGMPDSAEAREALENCFIRHLEEAGIEVSVTTYAMDQLEMIHRGEAEGPDLLYSGEDFKTPLDPDRLAPEQEVPEGAKTDSSLTAAKAEVYALALEAMRTEPNDIAGFMRKWVKLQERITETLPLLPVYSNHYFDFYSEQLHNYRITEAVSWGEAAVKSYLSDRVLPEKEEGAEPEEETDEEAEGEG